jgi:hypothetical protein
VGGLYAAHGACPFEGCDLRVWRVLKPIELRADPNPSAAIVATAAPGEWVRAVESVDFIMPQRGVVVADLGMLKPGDVIYLLDDLGEGFYQVWVRGELHQWSDDGSRDAADPTIRGGVKWTPGPEEQTAASVAPTTPPRGGWWVRVQRDSGGSGWTRAGENFACMGVIDASEECEAHQRPAPN